MTDGYELAWDELKGWVDEQYEYLVIPVKMFKDRMNELEDTFIEN